MADLTRKELVKLLSSPFRAHLTGTDLSGLDLNGLNFSSAYLANANLSKCNLQNTVFYKADLKNVRFVDSDVRGADFEQSALQNADFSGAIFNDKTNLKSASLKNTNISKEQKGISQTGISGEVVKRNLGDVLIAILGGIFGGGGRR